MSSSVVVAVAARNPREGMTEGWRGTEDERRRGREEEGERLREGKREEEWGRGRGIYATLSRPDSRASENPRRETRRPSVHPSVDAPISHVEPSASCRKEEGEGAREFFPYRSFASWKRNYYETNLFRSAPPTLPCLAFNCLADRDANPSDLRRSHVGTRLHTHTYIHTYV